MCCVVTGSSYLSNSSMQEASSCKLEPAWGSASFMTIHRSFIRFGFQFLWPSHKWQSGVSKGSGRNLMHNQYLGSGAGKLSGDSSWPESMVCF